MLDTGVSTFSLFIAIRYYNAGGEIKSMIAAAPWLGMIISLLMVHYASHTNTKKAVCAALPSVFAGVCLLAVAWIKSLILFAFFIITAYVCQTSMVPFLTSIYSDNYPPSQRGEFYSNPLRLTVGISILFSFLASKLLDLDLEYFGLVFSILGLCGLGKAWAIFSMPSKMIEGGEHNHPFGNFKYVVQDRSFGYVLLTWFIMGFANLWIQPLRVDYLTSDVYGITGSAALVALIIIIIPNGMRLIFIPFWGKLFDRMNFVVLRMVFNIIFAFGVGLYFITNNPVVIAMGSMLIGIAFAGGSIAWNLWVTKYAPPGKAAAYMSVHVCLTGIRGTIGPMVGFWAVEHVGPLNMGLISASLMALATIMLIPEIKNGNRKHL